MRFATSSSTVLSLALCGVVLGCGPGRDKELLDTDIPLPSAPIHPTAGREAFAGRLLEGSAALRRGDLDAATVAFEAHLVEFPKSALAPYNLGLIALERGKLPEARARLEVAWAANPRLYGAANALGVVYLQLGEDVAAQRVLEEARKLAPEDPRLLSTLAEARRRRGLWTQAVEALTTAVKQAPGHGGLSYNLAILLMEGERHADALGHLDTALGNRPRFVRAMAARTVCLVQLGRMTEAAAQIDAAERLEDDDPVVAFARGVVSEGKGDDAAALRAFQKAMKLDDEFARAWLGAAEALDRLGRTPKALEHYHGYLRRAKAWEPDRVRVRARVRQLTGGGPDAD